MRRLPRFVLFLAVFSILIVAVFSFEKRFARAEESGSQLSPEVQTPPCQPLYPTGGTEPTIKPGEKPPKNIPYQKIARTDFQRAVDRLGLQTVRAEGVRDGVLRNWGEQFVDLENQITGKTKLPRGAADQVYDRHSLIKEGERHPIEPVVRRTGALLDRLETEHGRAQFESLRRDWVLLDEYVQKTNAAEKPAEKPFGPADYFAACALRREVMFADPLTDFSKLLFLGRASYSGCRLTNLSNSDRIGGHFATQMFGFNTIHGGGLFVLSDWKSTTPKVTNLLEGKTVAGGRLGGKTLDFGSFVSPELSFDGRTVYFAHCGSQEHRWIWTKDTTWNLFKTQLDSNEILQLTDGPFNDFDPCELPDGRVAFISERRGGYIRCFGFSANLRVPTYVLHSMKNDGSDLYPISYFETSEWQPSVDNSGKLVYTRWDYTDRENCLGSNFWTCYPDGRDPRAPHGNYPQPWHTFDDNRFGDSRFGKGEFAPSSLPMTEMQFRAIPDSHRYVFTAAPHHGESFGSICVLDLRKKNDYHMNQIRRVTPYVPFPESEYADRSQYCYGAPWPLSEDVFLANRWEDLIVLDRFGNEELLVERELLPIGYDPRLRLSEPIPLRPRRKPPVIPRQTTQGEDFVDQNRPATIGVIDVYNSDLPLPKDRPIRWLRVTQVIPKPNPWMHRPFVGYAPENTPRVPLGIVPVEADGSVYFEAPAGKELIFQVLDENFCAVQSMRAAAYVHPGERLTCNGCHEDPQSGSQPTLKAPIAFNRAPSKLQPECGPVEPLSFYRHVRPILEKSCLPCHQEKKVEPTQMGFEDLRPYVFYFAGGMRGHVIDKNHGGTRTIPGRCGAWKSRLGRAMFDENHRETVSDADRRRLIQWLDSNAPRLSAFHNEPAQKRGELVWPLLDCDPKNPLGDVRYTPEKPIPGHPAELNDGTPPKFNLP